MMRHDDPPHPHNPIPIARLVVLCLVVLLSIWVFQALQSFLGANQEAANGFANPFADNLTPAPTQELDVIVRLSKALTQMSRTPGGYTAAVQSVDVESIQLGVERLNDDQGDPSDLQADTVSSICWLVVSIYENVDAPPPQQIVLHFDTRLRQLPTYKVQVQYSDVLELLRGKLTPQEFRSRWEAQL